MEKTDGCQYITDMGQALLDRATSVDAGKMIAIVAKTPIGIEWRSSLQGQWFMQVPSVRSLVKNWDGLSTVSWFWDAFFADGSNKRAWVEVSLEMMREIQGYLDGLDAGGAIAP